MPHLALTPRTLKQWRVLKILFEPCRAYLHNTQHFLSAAMCSIDFLESKPAENPYSAPLRSVLSLTSPSKADFEIAASQLVNQVSTTRRHDDALWYLLVAFFSIVPTASHSHCVALLGAIRAHPPTTPNRAEWSNCRETREYGNLYWSELPRFGLELCDQHDDIRAHRDQAGAGAEHYLNSVKFSAAWVKATGGDEGVDTVWVLLLPRDVLDRVHPEARTPRKDRVPTEQLWALDVKLAAIWIRDGAHALWNMDSSNQLLQKYWGVAIAYRPEDRAMAARRWAKERTVDAVADKTASFEC